MAFDCFQLPRLQDGAVRRLNVGCNLPLSLHRPSGRSPRQAVSFFHSLQDMCKAALTDEVLSAKFGNIEHRFTGTVQVYHSTATPSIRREGTLPARTRAYVMPCARAMHGTTFKNYIDIYAYKLQRPQEANSRIQEETILTSLNFACT